MAEGVEVLHAKIVADDDTSATIAAIKKHLHGLGEEAEQVGHKTEQLHHPHVFGALIEHIDLVHEHFHGLNLSVGEVGHSITELLPAFAAIGAGGSLVALFETTEHVAEAYAELNHVALSLGTTATQLQQLRIVAKLTDTNVEGMDKSIGRLNKTLAESASGKNKDAAALFAHLHLNPRSFHSAADALPALADAFEHTKDATMRARMAFVLFGRSGVDMIPMLLKGGEKLRESLQEASKLGIDFRPYAEGLERYNEDQKALNVATGGFVDLLGGKLAPVLAPLIEQSTELILANREWVTGEITGGVKEFADWLKKVPWHEVGDDVRYAAHETGEFVHDIGGAKVLVEGLAGVMALKGVLFLVEPIREVGELSLAVGRLIFRLGTELVGAWGGVETAAVAAGAAELAASGGAAAKAIPAVATEAASLLPEIEVAAAGIGAGAASIPVLPVIGGAALVAAAGAGFAAIAPAIPAIVGIDPATQGESQQQRNRLLGRGPYAGGHHDYGMPVDRPLSQRRDDAPTPFPGLAHGFDRFTDLFPRPLWDAHPGYGSVSSPGGPYDFGPLPAGPQSFQAPQGRSGDTGKVDIHISTDGLPQNSRIETLTAGNVGRVTTDLGRAFGDLYP